ncbi:MAG TPA: hypothetical protein VKW06_03330 [Candidatus Angelobacter sp.]|nr:hypothetical protein [Candidatus Angelobacter sp.]
MIQLINLFNAIRAARERLLQRPFWRLTAHFAGRLFSGSDDGGEGALNLGVGAMLALLATPGLFLTVLLFGKYSPTIRFFRGDRFFEPYAQSLPDQYFFFTFSMTITGIVVALKWESIFPGRRDYMNLAPLPICTRNIFLANMVAIVSIAVLFALDINSVSSFLFPLLVTMEKGTFYDYLRFIGMHVTGVLLSSLFIFFALFALVGSLMALLPTQLFHRLSIYIRVAVVIVMLALLCTSFAVPTLLRELSRSHSVLLRVLPPVWFVGLARSLIGKADPQLASLGMFGIGMILGVTALAGTVYLISYYRHFIRIPEQLETVIRTRAPRSLLPQSWLDRLLLRCPFERACYPFAFKTLLRNDRQSLLFGGIAGLGLVLAAQSLVAASGRAGFQGAGLPNPGQLAVPLILIFFVLCALRFVFDLPAELQANWAAQMIVDTEKHRAVPVARKVMLSLIWPAVIVVALPAYSYFWGWTVGIGHTIVLLAWSAGLADLLLRRFRKIPFTCAYSAWKQNATAMIVLYALGYAAFTSMTADFEYNLLRRHPLLLWIMGSAALAAWKLFLKFREDELDPTDLIFEEPPAPEVELLNLTGRLPSS